MHSIYATNKKDIANLLAQNLSQISSSNNANKVSQNIKINEEKNEISTLTITKITPSLSLYQNY